MNVAAFYILVPDDPQFANATAAFVQSYQRYPAGIDHRLKVLVKAHSVPTSVPRIPGAEYIPVGVEGYDIEPFMRQVPLHGDYDRLVLLGTRCRVMVDGWLERLCTAGPLVSPMASWEIRPHLRTAGICASPKVFGLMSSWRPGCKDDDWAFEHGPDSLYMTAKRAGIEGVMVGRKDSYREAEWPRAKVYRSGEQENLLLADGHSDAYQYGSPEERHRLAALAWGPQIVPALPQAATPPKAPITVITVTIPGRETLVEAIGSVYAQTPSVERHLICAHLAATEEPGQVQYARAKNDLLSAAQTPWVAVLNDDDRWLPGHVQAVLPYLDHADVIYSWDAGSTRPRVNCNGWSQAALVQNLDAGNFVDGNCLVRKAAVEAAGGFPTDWVGGRGARQGHYRNSTACFEDWELWRRMARRGARFRCVPQETWHYGTAAKGRLSK